MEITGKVHCFFEQSGVFKNEFIKLGFPAEDYDIQNNFGETDNVVDLFKAIEDAYEGKPSIFNKIGGCDLILAFFPCIYFEALQMTYYTNNCNNNRKQGKEKFDIILNRIEKREKLYKLLYKLIAVVEIKGLRLIIENPATQPHYLMFPENFYCKPSLIDKNRLLRGDYYRKPTAYWYINCKPTYGISKQKSNDIRKIQQQKGSKKEGLCSEERSLISSDYARNFICDFVIGREQKHSIKTLFD